MAAVAVISRPSVIIYDAFLLYVFFPSFYDRERERDKYILSVDRFSYECICIVYNAVQTRDVLAVTCKNVRTKRGEKLDVNKKNPIWSRGRASAILLRLWFVVHHARLSPSYEPRPLPYSPTRHTVIVDSLSGSCTA